MANLKTIGLIATLALGAAGFTACSGGKKAEEKPVTEAKQDTVPKQKKENITVMPPLTMVDTNLDTLVFNSKADSIEYRKYDGIAFDNFSRITTRDKEVSDSILSATKNEADSIYESERKEYEPKIDKIIEKYKAVSEALEQSYKDGKITFAKLEAEKKAIEEKENAEIGAVYSKYTKGSYANRAYDALFNLESRRHEKVDSEAYAKYEQDRAEMRAKYCKEVRPYVSPVKEPAKPSFVKGMEIDGVKVKWKSKEDSIAANNYMSRLNEKEEKANAKIYEQQQKLEQQKGEIECQIDQLEYEASTLYKQGKKQAAINKEAQIEKLEQKIDQLDIKIGELDEQCQYELISIDTINKHSVQKFDKNYKSMKWRF